jgi:WD40 repeat protein
MTIARQSHTATLLPNGTVIEMGGTELAPFYGDPTARVEIFDPTSQTFSSTMSMNVPRSSHTATTLIDGTILITGGSSSRAAEVYDPNTGSFALTGSMVSIRGHHAATLLNDGTVLITGGWGGLSTAELYDPNTEVFSPLGTMVYPHAEHTATLLPNGQVLIAAGTNCSPVCSSTTNAELYDPPTQMFTATENLARERTAHTATLLKNGKVLIAGGRSDSSAELYDFNGGTFESTGDMMAPRVDHTATRLLNGQVLVAGPFAAAADLYTPSP